MSGGVGGAKSRLFLLSRLLGDEDFPRFKGEEQLFILARSQWLCHTEAGIGRMFVRSAGGGAAQRTFRPLYLDGVESHIVR